MSVSILGILAGLAVLVLTFLKMFKKKSKSSHHAVVLSGFIPVETVEKENGVSEEELQDFALRLKLYWEYVWPKLKEAYGLSADYPFPVSNIRVFREPWSTRARLQDGDVRDIHAVGETFFSYPAYTIWLVYDPDGVGAFGWELRNVAKHEAAVLKGEKFNEWVRDTQADKKAEQIIKEGLAHLKGLVDEYTSG